MRKKKQTNYQRLDRTVVAIAKRDDRLRELVATFVEEDGQRFCRASILARFLGYESLASFERCINEAQITASNSNVSLRTNFIEIALFNGGEKDILLSEWAAYAVVMEADPRKPRVALAKSFFAAVAEKQAKHEESRLKERQVAKKLHKHLHRAAEDAGVKTADDHAIFDDHGYRGMYGRSVSEIERLKGVPGDQKLIDLADHTELAANNLRMSLTADKILKECIRSKVGANNAHFDVGKIVRQAVIDAAGTPPEQLPLAKESINALSSRKASELRTIGV
ncbi:MAG: hypothetical protein IT445_20985 [Phycisphaeraceae bacterium]|nr:hypothetical protein [Phycisphaeraceae bacterium]